LDEIGLAVYEEMSFKVKVYGRSLDFVTGELKTVLNEEERNPLMPPPSTVLSVFGRTTYQQNRMIDRQRKANVDHPYM
jgi:hypothetical protein